AYEQDPAGHGHGRGGEDQQPEGQQERGLTIHRPKATRREPSAESWPELASWRRRGRGRPARGVARVGPRARAPGRATRRPASAPPTSRPTDVGRVGL